MQECFDIDKTDVFTEWRRRADRGERPFVDLDAAVADERLNPRLNRSGYAQTLTNRARAALQRQKAHQVIESVTKKYDGNISVIALNAKSYCTWLDEKRSEDPSFGPNMSGISYLRNALLSRIAKPRLAAYTKYYFDDLENVGELCRRFINKISQDQAGARRCRVKLEQLSSTAIDNAKKEIDSLLSKPLANAIFRESEKEKINSLINSLINKHWGPPTDGSAVAFATWQHTLMCGGIPDSYGSRVYRDRKNVDWNRDLLATFQKPDLVQHEFTSKRVFVLDWINEIVSRSVRLAGSITMFITQLWTLNRVHSAIIRSELDWNLTFQLLKSWEVVVGRIRKEVARLPAAFKTALIEVYRRLTTEDVYGTIADLNKDAYKSAMLVRCGKGVYKRQRQALTNALINPFASYLPNRKYFLEDYEQIAVRMTGQCIRDNANECLESVRLQLDDCQIYRIFSRY